MDLILTRTRGVEHGIFGILDAQGGRRICVTLEHAYPFGGVLYVPKLPDGDYQCVRGAHRLASQDNPFMTFEIMGVPGHTGMLFHVGNYNRDSAGCVLVGTGFTKFGIRDSRLAFIKFMQAQAGQSTFALKVVTV